MLQRILTYSPADWSRIVQNRLTSWRSRIAEPGPRARIPTPEYMDARATLIASLMERVQAGTAAADVLVGFDATRFDERVAEYVLAAEWLLQGDAGQDLLDVGCVMNNPIVRDLLETRCANVWFGNIAVEPIAIANPVFYHLRPLDHAFPNGPTFRHVTCLSTIEHIGFDNRQYGAIHPVQYRECTDEPLVRSLRRLADFVQPGGRLLVSVPFGKREVSLHPKTGRRYQQVFDANSVEAGLSALHEGNLDASATVYQIGTDGWAPTDAAACSVRYADGCPGAAAVAVFRGEKSPD